MMFTRAGSDMYLFSHFLDELLDIAQQQPLRLHSARGGSTRGHRKFCREFSVSTENSAENSLPPPPSPRLVPFTLPEHSATPRVSTAVSESVSHQGRAGRCNARRPRHRDGAVSESRTGDGAKHWQAGGCLDIPESPDIPDAGRGTPGSSGPRLRRFGDRLRTCRLRRGPGPRRA